MKIDFHAHLFPKRFLAELERRGLEFGLPGMPFAALPKMYELEERLRDMDAIGMDLQALSLGPPGVEVGTPRDSVALAKLFNEEVARIVQDDPRHFTGLAALPLQSPDEALGELDRAVTELGLRGAHIFSNVAGQTLDAPAYWPLYERAQELDVPIFIHPITPVCTTAQMEYGLMLILGFVLDTSLAASRLIFSGVMDRYPELKFVLAHLGGTLPYVIARLDVESSLLAQFVPGYDLRIHQPPSAYFQRFYLDTVSHHAPAYYCACQTSGAERVVLGSDYPYSRWEQTIAEIAALEISAEDKEKIYGGNAARLLKL